MFELTGDDSDAHMAVNVRATFLLCQAFARRFDRPAGTGRIVNFISGLPLAGSAAYAASKGAIQWMSVSIGAELAPLGITVNCVNPGPTDTGWMSPDIRVSARSPLGRLGQPTDAARLVAFLCADAGGWITGQSLSSDGGFSTLR